ncbi:hypothetical protein Hdeb2414_s0013g00404551 [Helianthus debilis subsp. tardiflorus]
MEKKSDDVREHKLDDAIKMAGVKKEEGSNVGANHDTKKKTPEDVNNFPVLGKRRKRQACRLPSKKSFKAVRVPFSSTQEGIPYGTEPQLSSCV